jgi:hypothetical protein
VSAQSAHWPASVQLVGLVVCVGVRRVCWPGFFNWSIRASVWFAAIGRVVCTCPRLAAALAFMGAQGISFTQTQGRTDNYPYEVQLSRFSIFITLMHLFGPQFHDPVCS